jgi:hypothetical protein
MKQRLDKDAVFRRFYSTYTANTLSTKLLKDLYTKKEEDKQFRTAKYAVGLVLLAMEESVLQAMTEGLIEIGRCIEWK